MDPAWLDRVGRDLDRPMKAAILALYRSADPGVLGDAGAASGRLTCPALVLWGEQDPYIPVAEAARVASSLGGPSLVRTYRGGHWLIVDRPEVADEIVEWLGATPEG
jgi:pimeloyl-ACP methyl ester carboxylesterase